MNADEEEWNGLIANGSRRLITAKEIYKEAKNAGTEWVFGEPIVFSILGFLASLLIFLIATERVSNDYSG